jgi:hypothetical protein
VKPARAGEQPDPVAGQLASDHVDLAPDHMLGTRGQVGDGDVVLEPVALAVHLALAQAGEVEDRLPQRLGRDRTGVDADPTEHVLPFDDGNPTAEFRRRDRGLLATRTRTHDEHVEIMHGHSLAADRSESSGRTAR